MVENLPSISKSYECNAVLCLSIYCDGQIVYGKKYDDWRSRFYGSTKGIILGDLLVPKDIKLGSNYDFKLSVISPDPDFNKNYGATGFYIKRRWDVM